MSPHHGRPAARSAAVLVACGAALLVSTPAQAAQYGAYEAHGAIEQQYLALGGPSSFLHLPTTNETPTPDGQGRFNHFQGDAGGPGSVYWSPSTGAAEVHGQIRATWQATGWELGPLGYPVTNERPTPRVVGRFNLFASGSIYWSPTTGAHEVYGAILGKYAQLGWEQSALGFPTTGEYAVPGGRRNDFQGGWITWTPAAGAVVNGPATPPPPGPTPPPPPPGPTPPPVPGSYANCDDMHASGYPHGIGLPGAVDSTSSTPVTDFYVSVEGYWRNSGSDRDGDDIACEA